MDARAFEQQVQKQLGLMVFQMLALQTENEELRAKLAAVAPTREPDPAP